jgi:glycosyltransferase involved in cell wall biosynthesis
MAPLVCLHLKGEGEGGAAAAQRAIAAWRAALPGLEVLVAGPAGSAVTAGNETLPLPPEADMAAALAAAHAARPQRDIAYVRGGAELPDDWVALLARALRRDPRVGAALPLCDALQLFSPYAGARPGWVEPSQIRCWLARLARGRVFEVPLVLPVCGLFRAAALADLAAAGALAAAGDLAIRLRARGWSAVACDWVLAHWPGGRLAAPLPPEDADIRAFAAHHPLAPLRRQLADALSGGPAVVPPPTPALRPVQLHVTHSWGGGLGRWVRDLCAADGERHHLVLRSLGDWSAFGYRLALYAGAGPGAPLREWTLDFPIRSVAATHYHYRRILAEIRRDFEVDLVVVSSLIGHSLDALDSGLPTLVALHDFFPFCPALSIHFGDVCGNCDRERLSACFAENPLNRYFADSEPEHWLGIRARYLDLLRRPGVRLVAPSEAVFRHLRQLAPGVAEVPASVIPNGSSPLPRLPAPPAEGRLRVLVLGSLAAQKGTGILRAGLAGLTDFADLFLLGCGDEGREFEGIPGVQVTRSYQLEDLPGLLAEIRPHVGLLLSIVPETFSYTLSELWMLGVPPVATRLGAFAERIEDGRTGWLIEPEAEALLRRLRELDRDRTRLDAVREEIARLPVWTPAAMAAAYREAMPLPLGSGIPGPGPGAQPPLVPQRTFAVDPEAGALRVTQDFLDYLLEKIAGTARLGRWGRWLIALPLRAARRLLRR